MILSTPLPDMIAIILIIDISAILIIMPFIKNRKRSKK